MKSKQFRGDGVDVVGARFELRKGDRVGFSREYFLCLVSRGKEIATLGRAKRHNSNWFEWSVGSAGGKTPSLLGAVRAMRDALGIVRVHGSFTRDDAPKLTPEQFQNRCDDYDYEPLDLFQVLARPWWTRTAAEIILGPKCHIGTWPRCKIEEYERGLMYILASSFVAEHDGKAEQLLDDVRGPNRVRQLSLV